MRDRGPSKEFVELRDMLSKFKNMKELYEGKSSGKLNVETLLPLLENFGRYLAKSAGLKSSQIRKFFDAVKNIQNEFVQKEISKGEIRQRILRLKPALAYATARQRHQLQSFTDIMYMAMDKVEDKKDFDYFVEFLEAIVAYHKYHGGKD